jgi:hypothetical protein
MLNGRYQLAPADAVVWKAALDRYAKPDPTGEATDEQGETLKVRDERTKAMREADAMVAMARAATGLDTGTGTGSPAVRVLVEVIATPDQVAQAHGTEEPETEEECASAGPSVPEQRRARGSAGLAHCLGFGQISAGTLSRLGCTAIHQPILLNPTGAVLNLGRSTRLATPRQRAALIVRDRGCAIPGCGAPPERCDAHHVRYWRHGGRTDIDNLALLCSRHHDAVHTGAWTLTMRDGIPWAIPPKWLDPYQHPLRNTTHQAIRDAGRLGEQLRLNLNGSHVNDTGLNDTGRHHGSDLDDTG